MTSNLPVGVSVAFTVLMNLQEQNYFFCAALPPLSLRGRSAAPNMMNRRRVQFAKARQNKSRPCSLTGSESRKERISPERFLVKLWFQNELLNCLPGIH